MGFDVQRRRREDDRHRTSALPPARAVAPPRGPTRVRTDRGDHVDRSGDAAAPAAPVDVFDRFRRLAAVDVPTSTDRPSRVAPLSHYMQAASARMDGQLLARRDRGSLRPEGVEDYVWNPSGALARQGVDTEDVATFALDGVLADRVDEETGRVVSGQERLRRLEERASRGDWTAVNTLTFLVGARRAALVQEGAADPSRAQATRAADRVLARSLNTLYQRATQGRESRARRSLVTADRLDARAARAQSAGDEAQATRLRERADRVRASASQRAASEVRYRRRFSRTFDLTSALATHAQTQISSGAAVVDRARLGGALPSTAPASLGRGRELITEARDHARTQGDDSHETRLLDLDRRALRATGDFHGLHLDRGGAALRGDARRTHLRGLFTARRDEAGVIDQRLARSEGEPPLVRTELELRRSRISAEFARVYGDAIAADHDATAARSDERALRRAARDARSDARTERSAAATEDENHDDAVDRNDPILDMRSDGEGRRDTELVLDSDHLAGSHRARARELDARARRFDRGADAAVRRGAAARAQARVARGDADVLASVLDGDTPNPFGSDLTRYTSHRVDADTHFDRARTALREPAAAGEAPGARTALRLSVAEAAIADARTEGRVRRGEDATAMVVLTGPRPTRPDQYVRESQRTRLDAAREQLGLVAETNPTAQSTLVRLVSAEASLGETEAAHRPGLAATDLERAGRHADQLTGPVRAAARERVALADTTAIAAQDQNFDAIVAEGNYDRTAADRMYRQAHQILDGTRPTTDTGRAAADRLGAIDRALNSVQPLFQSAQDELRSGAVTTDATARVLTHHSIQAAQAKMLGLLTGPVWAITALGETFNVGETIDAREIEAGMQERELSGDSARMWLRTDRRIDAMRQLQRGFGRAMSEGRPFEYLGALRIIGGSADDATQADALRSLYSMTEGEIRPGMTAQTGDGPAAAALHGSLFGLEGAADSAQATPSAALPDSVRGGIVRSAQSRLRRSTHNLEGILAFNLATEAAIGLVVTGGLGSLRAVAVAEGAVESISMAQRIYGAVRTATLVGGAMTAASFGARELFGHSSGAARFVDSLGNFLPMGAAGRVSGASQMATIGMGSAQAALTSLAVPRIAGAVGIESELGQALVGLGLGALMAGGLGALGARRVGRMADDAIGSLRRAGAIDEAHVPAVRAEIVRFLSRHSDGAPPSTGEVAALLARVQEISPRAAQALGVEAGAASAMVDRSRAQTLAAALVSDDDGRARVDHVLSDEMGGLRAALEGDDGRPSFDALRRRLVEEGGLDAASADQMVDAVRADVFDRALATQLRRAAVDSGAELPPHRIEAITRETARRAGFSAQASDTFATEVAQSAGVRDWLATLVLGPRRGYQTMSPADRQAEFIRRNPTAGSSSGHAGLDTMSPAQFQRAFGDGPYHPQLAELAQVPGFAQFAIAHPDEAGRMYHLQLSLDIAGALQGSANPNFMRVLAINEAALPTDMVSTTASAGRLRGRTIQYRVVDGTQSPNLRYPGLRLSPTAALDHNGAFMQSTQVPGRGWGSERAPTEVGRNWMFLQPGQLVIGPNDQRATIAQLPHIAVFAGHGASDGFTGLTTPHAASMMADAIQQHHQRGRPRIRWVALECCSQGDRRGLLGMTGETNAAVFQRELNRELAARGLPTVEVLAAERPGVLYGGADYSGIARGPGGPAARFVPPSQQRWGVPRENYRRYGQAFGGVAALMGVGAGATYYTISELERRRERARAAAAAQTPPPPPPPPPPEERPDAGAR